MLREFRHHNIIYKKIIYINLLKITFSSVIIVFLKINFLSDH